MRRVILFIALSAFIAGTTAMLAGVAARQVPATVSSSVSVRAIVERPDGTFVTGLTRDDFDVLVDGQPQVVASVSEVDGPVSVLVLIDASASMNLGDVASHLVLSRAMEQWLPFSLKPGDRARIGNISRRGWLSERFTSDKQELVRFGFAARTVAPADRMGPSPIWDAIDGAVSALEWEGGARSILIVTDGRATGNRVSLKEAGAHAMASAVEVHVIAERDTPIAIQQLDGSLTHVLPGAGLRWLAEQTGGSYASDKRFPWSDPGPLFAQAIRRLHHAYTVGFIPSTPDGGVHAIEIKAKSPGLTVRARKQFIANR